MEYYFGILNRTYQVFVTPNVIAGAFVRSIMTAPLFGLLQDWFEPLTYVNKGLTRKYELTSPESTKFKELSPLFNFQYSRMDIRRSWYDPTLKWGMGTVAHSGKLYIELESGRRREFILLGLQQGQEILHRLQSRLSIADSISNDEELRASMKAAFEQPQNRAAWLRLAEQFATRREQAQEIYCQIHIASLR